MACAASLGTRNADMASVSRSSRPWARWKSLQCGKVSTFPTASSQPPARCSVASSVRNCQPCPGPTLASIASRSRSTCCRTPAPPSAPACTRRNVLPSAASRSLRAPARGGRGQRRPPSGRGHAWGGHGAGTHASSGPDTARTAWPPPGSSSRTSGASSRAAGDRRGAIPCHAAGRAVPAGLRLTADYAREWPQFRHCRDMHTWSGDGGKREGGSA